jgi:hypothetical protein
VPKQLDKSKVRLLLQRLSDQRLTDKHLSEIAGCSETSIRDLRHEMEDLGDIPRRFPLRLRDCQRTAKRLHRKGQLSSQELAKVEAICTPGADPFLEWALEAMPWLKQV